MDPRVADYRNVPDPQLLERDGIFIAEGRLVVRRLLAGSRFTTRSIMVTQAALGSLEPETVLRPDIPIYLVPQPLMNTIAGFNIHRGCLAVGERRVQPSWRELAARANRLAILECVGDADNVGSTFRSALALGMDAVLLDSASADPLYRKAIRTSMGASLLLPFARFAAEGEASVRANAGRDVNGKTSEGNIAQRDRHRSDWPGALAELGSREGMAVVALTPSQTAAPLQMVAERLIGRRVALVLGHEGHGLTRDTLDACEFHARIPMAPGVDSLNVATAAAIAMYELGRTRG